MVGEMESLDTTYNYLLINDSKLKLSELIPNYDTDIEMKFSKLIASSCLRFKLW